MKLVVLTAGLGTRMRPHTFSQPKSLVNVAGKPMLAHVLDPLLSLPIDELIVVTGHMGQQVEAFVRASYHFPTTFFEQTEFLGQAHAIYLARDVLHGPTLIVFGDGIIVADFAGLQSATDGVLHVQAVDDPARFGVAVVRDGWVTRLVEKPDTPVSNLAVLGVYYVPEGQRLIAAIEHMLDQDIRSKGEYYLADALQIMIDRGERFRTAPVTVWADCGTIPALLEANRFLLDHGHHHNAGEVVQSVVIPPVSIAATARVEQSVIGPYVTVAAGATVRHACVRDSIINASALVQSVVLHQSVIGASARVQGQPYRCNIGDAAEVWGED